jgi:hypothetical protein
MPIQLWEKLGQVIDRDYSADEVIEP